MAISAQNDAIMRPLFDFAIPEIALQTLDIKEIRPPFIVHCFLFATINEYAKKMVENGDREFQVINDRREIEAIQDDEILVTGRTPAVKNDHMDVIFNFISELNPLKPQPNKI